MPEPISNGKGIAHSRATTVQTITGTQIQWMTLLSLLWWLSPYSFSRASMLLITLFLA